jgi:uncharacterized protein (DUF1800 family)
MYRAPFHRFWTRTTACAVALFSGGAFFLATGLPGSEVKKDVPTLLLTPASPKATSDVTFPVPKTQLWLGRSQVLCFYAPPSADEDRFISFAVDEKYLHVLAPPVLLHGSNLGYLRVRPLIEGQTQITLDGANLAIQIVRDASAGTLEQTRPEIIAPDDGAVVWGKFTVGVEQLNLSSSLHPILPVLRLPGQDIPAQVVPNQQPGPHLRYAFTVDAAALHPGANELRAVTKDEAGHEIASEPVNVFVVKPDAASLLAGDCKDQVNTQLPPKPTPVPPPANPPKPPKPFVPPTVVADDKGTFGSIVVSLGDSPAWTMPVTVPGNGRYAMMLTARGDIGANALPSLALEAEDTGHFLTMARVATTEWQRMPVGRPFVLDSGTHYISIHFRNGINQGPMDKRCLYLARYELVRLDPPSAPTLAANTPASTTTSPMMQDAASMQSKDTPAPIMQETPAPAMQEMQAKSGSSMMQDVPPAGGFHLVFKDPLQGRMIMGPVEIDAMCWWRNLNHAPEPKIDVLVNDKIVASLSTPQPQFHVPLTAFQTGSNTIQLRGTLANGQTACSPVESLLLPVAPSSVARILYPADGAKVGLADAVVANVWFNDDSARADLYIDGQPQHFNLTAPKGLGPVLFPLLTRNLSPGRHSLQVLPSNQAGKTGTGGGEIFVNVTGNDEPTGTYARALFLLNRFGYGPEPRELTALLATGPQTWLAAHLNETMSSPSEENERERLRADHPDTTTLPAYAFEYLLTDPNPVRARFVMWTENHFSTWLSKDGAPEKSREHDRFLELGIAPFSDLLLASATSPAMLIYLDQRNSAVKHLNENYAREIMELHTLGVKGGYTQQDVTALADLLTGWMLTDEAPLDTSTNVEQTFRYDPYQNSGNACRILGMDFPGVPIENRFDRVVTALNMLSAHPSCATFVSRKLLEHYVSDPAPPELVNDLAQIYLQTGGDVQAMLLALSEKPAFWAAPTKIASPIDFSVRLARLAGVTDPATVIDLTSHTGMGIFDRATPDGYPETDGYYASSTALLQRWHFAQTVQNAFLAHGLIPDAWKPTDQQWTPETIQRLVDLAAVRITGNVLSANSNTAALQLIADAPADTDGRLHLLATFLCQVPETSLR